ncbi:MAG TPA: hypothetical protein VFJ72_09090 [Rubrobacteraceae bacterium]|nr:hypothetical protein [Rubrobacteraceae bacterium]
MEKMSNQEPERRERSRERQARKRRGPDEFWENIGLDVESMSPRVQAITGVVTGGLILLAAALVLTTQLWWLIFVFGWAVFPAFGVFARGVAGLVEARSELPPRDSREKELLEALQRRGELTPAQAAMETSLSVRQADEMLENLASKGHLDVRVRGGGIFYSLWDHEERADERRLEGGK